MQRGVLGGASGVIFEQGNTRKLEPAGPIRTAECKGEGEGGSTDCTSYMNMPRLNENGQLLLWVRGEQVEV